MAAGQGRHSIPHHCCVSSTFLGFSLGSARTNSPWEQEWPTLVILEPRPSKREGEATKEPGMRGEN